jgi:ankyrin repeat protein
LDPKSVIGMTIEPNGNISAAHDKLDVSVHSSFKSIIANMGIPFKVFTPMTEEEIQIKKKRIEASKKIIDPNLTLELAEEYLKNGADPNAKSGTPLINAVKADNKDLVNLLLKKGARPNTTGPNNTQTAVTYSSNLDMVKILVGAGATLNSSVFTKLSKNYESVKYLLESGLDPNFERGYPFRTASMAGDLKIMDILLKFADNVPDEKMSIKEKQLLILNERRRMALKWACDSGKDESVLFILDKLKELDDTDLTKDPEKFILSLLDYVDSSEGINSDQKLSMSNKIKEWLSINFNVKNESKRFRLFKDFIY